MNIGFNLLETNLAMPLSYIAILVLFVCTLVFFAKDFKIGMIMLFFQSGLLFLWFYYMNSTGDAIDYSPPLILMFISIVIMALSLYAVEKTSKEGGFIG